MKKKQIIKEISQIFHRINGIIDEQVESLSTTVDNIVSDKIKDRSVIEEALDWLLDCCYMGKGKRQFKRLNRYYFNIRPRFSKKYDGYYKEVTKEDHN